AIFRGRRHRFGAPTNDFWGVDILAALSEMAAAKALGIYWADAPEPDVDGDVGPYFVRHTERPDGCLILHPADHDDRVYILVVGSPPSFRVVGWLWGREGKLQSYWRSDLARPCFMAPQEQLHGMDVLP